MNQNGNLYCIVRDDGVQVALRMNESHRVYEGHFPGTPITPGVLTLQMIRECASRKTGRRLRYRTIKNCRFAAMVRPGDTLQLKMDMAADGDVLKLKATLTDADNDEDLRLQLDAELQ